ncbi:MAG: hypothetical protein U5L95_05140 [Candidatus Saccharibacteria bacterium]|nr:hypothetical protein [Candidatus Saccharibacteria bacterium]
MKGKVAKLPGVNDNTRFLCFDLESNGLHGRAFAAGALIIDKNGEVHDEFTARVEIEGEVDEWVKDNVLPQITDMQITHGSYKAMCDSFWRWFVPAQEKSDYVLVSNGYPVEYRFLMDCQQADPKQRYWEHPFPVIDLSSLLLPLGELKELSKSNLLKKIERRIDVKQHHPLNDAEVTGLMAFEALRFAGRIT